ncbi:MAG: hypothetical protein BWY15_00495 [Firmicutes bacterium ADurb.Bin193]|nr:MAG: hypothetical protein BWY15_00495 [Firmicutes bacterium ADurb.Bin193]
MEGFYVFDDIGKRIAIRANSKASHVPRHGNYKTIILSMLLVLTIIECSVLFGERILLNNKVISIIKELQLSEKNASQLEIRLQEAENKLLEKNNKVADVASNNDTVTFKAYTVKVGDTLTEIYGKLCIDYETKKSSILKINHISDENKIFVGDTLYLPID